MGHGHKTINQCAGWVAADFLTQLKTYMNEEEITQAELAEKLGVTEGRVSQIFRKPDNLSLRSVVKLVRALGLKVAVMGYDSEDNAPHVAGEAVREAWEQAGRPKGRERDSLGHIPNRDTRRTVCYQDSRLRRMAIVSPWPTRQYAGAHVLSHGLA